MKIKLVVKTNEKKEGLLKIIELAKKEYERELIKEANKEFKKKLEEEAKDDFEKYFLEEEAKEDLAEKMINVAAELTAIASRFKGGL